MNQDFPFRKLKEYSGPKSVCWFSPIILISLFWIISHVILQYRNPWLSIENIMCQPLEDSQSDYVCIINYQEKDHQSQSIPSSSPGWTRHFFELKKANLWRNILVQSTFFKMPSHMLLLDFLIIFIKVKCDIFVMH